MLEQRALGSTGLRVSCLGLGTVKFGRNQGVKYPAAFALPDERNLASLLALASELGINLLDTAPAYGSSEERLGRLLVNRDRWVLCSKVGEEFEDGGSRFDFSAGHTRRSVERSLRSLRTDYLDLVLVHSDGRDEEILRHTDCLDSLHRLREQGLIRAIGMSTKTVSGGMAAVAATDVVMVTCNPQATDDLPVIAAAAEHHKGVLVKKALASGHLTSVESSDPVQASLDFVLGQRGVASIIVGTINPQHLRHNVACAQKAVARSSPTA